MSKIHRIGISDTITTATQSNTNLTNTNWYNVEFTHYEDGEGYVVKCLDLPGCISQGDTEDKATENIIEAIKLYEEMKKEEIISNAQKFIDDNKSIFDELAKK